MTTMVRLPTPGVPDAIRLTLTTHHTDASCSKLGDRNLGNNAAAYLLFYRRRSSNPLGPQYLQDLVNEARNPVAPTDSQANDDTAAEESDSGEGRLGGRANGSLRSSGGWNGAGAGANSARGGSGGISGARQGAGSSLMTKGETGTSEGEPGKLFYGPERPPHMREYGDQGSAEWNWGAIDRGVVTGDEDAASDAGSMHANVDQDDDGDQFMGNNLLDDTPPPLEPPDPFGNSPAGAGTPNADAASSMDYNDDHALYSTGREYEDEYDHDGVLHLENAGSMGADAESISTVEMRSPPPVGGGGFMLDEDADADTIKDRAVKLD